MFVFLFLNNDHSSSYPHSPTQGLGLLVHSLLNEAIGFNFSLRSSLKLHGFGLHYYCLQLKKSLFKASGS